MIETRNHGPLILSSTFWGSEQEQAGKLFVSLNAGVIRILVPAVQRSMIAECRGCKFAVLSRGPWPEAGLAEGVEILFEDESDDPYALHLSPSSFDSLPGEPPTGREWVIALWDSKKGKPHKALERVCHWRRVERIPSLKPYVP